MASKKYMDREDIRNQLIEDVSIVDIIRYFGETELLDNIDAPVLRAYLENARKASCMEGTPVSDP